MYAFDKTNKIKLKIIYNNNEYTFPIEPFEGVNYIKDLIKKVSPQLDLSTVNLLYKKKPLIDDNSVRIDDICKHKKEMVINVVKKSDLLLLKKYSNQRHLNDMTGKRTINIASKRNSQEQLNHILSPSNYQLEHTMTNISDNNVINHPSTPNPNKSQYQMKTTSQNYSFPKQVSVFPIKSLLQSKSHIQATSSHDNKQDIFCSNCSSPLISIFCRPCSVFACGECKKLLHAEHKSVMVSGTLAENVKLYALSLEADLAGEIQKFRKIEEMFKKNLLIDFFSWKEIIIRKLEEIDKIFEEFEKFSFTFEKNFINSEILSNEANKRIEKTVENVTLELLNDKKSSHFKKKNEFNLELNKYFNQLKVNESVIHQINLQVEARLEEFRINKKLNDIFEKLDKMFGEMQELAEKSYNIIKSKNIEINDEIESKEKGGDLNSITLPNILHNPIKNSIINSNKININSYSYNKQKSIFTNFKRNENRKLSENKNKYKKSFRGLNKNVNYSITLCNKKNIVSEYDSNNLY